jgi:hypothetical protein
VTDPKTAAPSMSSIRDYLFNTSAATHGGCLLCPLRTRYDVVTKDPFNKISWENVALGGLVVSVLATGPKVRGFNSGRGRWIFKNP